MVGITKDITLKEIVSTVVDKIFSEGRKGKMDWKNFWEDAWDQILDEAEYYGIFVKNNVLPQMPDIVTKFPDKKEEIKKLLLQVIIDRTKP
jgi:hypothetical protein